MDGPTERVDRNFPDGRETSINHLETAVKSDTPDGHGFGAAPSFIRIPATGKALNDIEREAIELTMSLMGNNQTVTARILGISRPTLLRKLREHRIARENLSRLHAAGSEVPSTVRRRWVRDRAFERA